MDRIDPKLVKKELCIYPCLPAPDNGTSGEEELWLEIAQFVKDDLQWLLSIKYDKFWSYMVYAENARQLLVSFLKQSPPNYLRNDLLTREDIKTLFKEIERLVFLVYLRLSTDSEFDDSLNNNIGEVIYNNYLFTIPVILDICSNYGVSNRELVKKMIKNVFNLAPDFWDDLQELLPQFIKALQTVKDKFSVEQLPKLKHKIELTTTDLKDLVFYLHDSVSTIQVFLDLYMKARELFCKPEVIIEIVSFYSNVIPEIENRCRGNAETETRISLVDLIENTRIDLLKIVKSIFDYLGDSTLKPGKVKEESVDECLTLMMEFLSEPFFLSDYNTMYSLEFEIESLIQGCTNLDTIKINHILEGVGLAIRSEICKKEKKSICREVDFAGAKVSSLITEVNDILPHLHKTFIKECLKHYQNNTERVIAAILEDTLPLYLKNWNPEAKKTEESSKRKQHKDLTELLDDRNDLNEIKNRYAVFNFLPDEDYDDEYDDTYDENLDVSVREADEMEKNRRPFVTPRVLRTEEESEEENNEEEEEDDDEELKQGEKRDFFVPNPAEIREKIEHRKVEKSRKDVVGNSRGQGQSKQVLRNREFKGAHKSFTANHNRKKQAKRKMNQGMIPS